MKRFLCILLISSMSCISSCCEKPVEPGIVIPPPPKPDVVPPNIALEQVQFLPFGGDPRGTYYPNNPLVVISGNEPSVLEIIPPTVNDGTGKLVLSGTSSTSGTWYSQNFSLRFDGKLKLRGSPYPISTVNHDSLAKFFRQGAGRWAISRNFSAQIFISNRTDVFDFQFTADSLGMYFYTSPPRISFPPDANTILCTTIFKKQR